MYENKYPLEDSEYGDAIILGNMIKNILILLTGFAIGASSIIIIILIGG